MEGAYRETLRNALDGENLADALGALQDIYDLLAPLKVNRALHLAEEMRTHLRNQHVKGAERLFPELEMVLKAWLKRFEPLNAETQ